MIRFDDFAPTEGQPIYLQILNYIKRGAVAGTIADGDELPSRRMLSARLGINPNTVQKAFHLLEEEGLIESRTGAKSCMTLDEKKLERLKVEQLEGYVRSFAQSMKEMAITRDEAQALLERFWDGEGK